MKKKSELNNKAEEIYIYIVNFTKENLFPPTVREIASAVNLSSTSSVSRYLRLLEQHKLIEVKDKHPRSIKISNYQFVKKDS